MRELIKLKDELISETATPPMYLKTDLKTFDLTSMGTKFDVILIEPPLEEYFRGAVVASGAPKILGLRSFWCGSSDGLDIGRNCLRKRGFRRCEDIYLLGSNEH